MNCDNAPLKGDKGFEPSVFEPQVRFRFKRKEHLKGRKEIREVFDKGKRFGVCGAKLFVLKNDLPYNRICFSFPRGFGNAVVRNRARRLGREAFRLLKPRLNGAYPKGYGYDLVLLVYPEKSAQAAAGNLLPEEKVRTKSSAFSHRARQLETLFKKAGLLK